MKLNSQIKFNLDKICHQTGNKIYVLNIVEKVTEKELHKQPIEIGLLLKRNDNCLIK